MENIRKIEKTTAVIIFSAAFGLLEAIVVTYISVIMKYRIPVRTAPDRILINLGFVNFLTRSATTGLLGKITIIESWREISTIIILLSLAYLSATRFRERLGAFLMAFGFWDIFYYIWLRMLTGAPRNILSPDVYFLLPVASVGPVITPVFISLLMIISGYLLI